MTRLEKIELKLRPEDKDPRLVIVVEDEDGTWHDGQGTAIDPATLDPRMQVIRFRQRPDGPQ